MNKDRLLAHFDAVVDTPGAVQRLRRFILDLAVRGKLVPQDPNEEPASELLRRTAAATENARLVKAKRIKSTKPETGHDHPDLRGWSIASVGSLLVLHYGKGMGARDRLEKGPVPVFGSNGIVGYCERALTEMPAIIIGRKGSAGALNLCDGPSWTTDVAYYVEAPDPFDIRYLFIGLQTLDLDSLGKGVKPGLSRNEVYELSLGVPPLAEQIRIVVQVDKLMTLCDRLDATISKRESTRDRFAVASLVRMGAPEPDPVTAHAHAAFAIDNFDRITTRSDQIKTLRKTILNLAVRGALVAQNPNDEPASEYATRKINCHLDTAPFDLPRSWTWAKVGAVAKSRLGKMLDRTKNRGTPHKYLRNINVRWFDFDLTDLSEMRLEDSELSELSLRYGDVLICEGGEPGRAAVWDERETGIYFQKAIHRVRFRHFVNPRYFVLSLRASADDGRLEEYFTGTGIRHFTGKGLARYLFPLPPLAEQCRIVARVDELMALCDRLEERLITMEGAGCRLLDAMLHEALEPDTGGDEEAPGPVPLRGTGKRQSA